MPGYVRPGATLIGGVNTRKKGGRIKARGKKKR